MGTRSTIAMELQDGTVKQVYCHWDGYLSHNGQILFDNYSDQAKLQELISLGDISSLRPEIGTKHPFGALEAGLGLKEYYDLYDHMTTFYGRDRDETGIEPKSFSSFEDYKNNMDSQEYDYIMRKDGMWYVGFYLGFMTLEEAFVKSKEEEDA